MSNNIKFWLVASILFLIFFWSGIVVGAIASIGISEKIFTSVPVKEPTLGAYGLLMLATLTGLIGGAFGLIIALIFIRRLGKKWGGSLNYGSHPILKLTGLSFITFLIASLIILELVYQFNK